MKPLANQFSHSNVGTIITKCSRNRGEGTPTRPHRDEAASVVLRASVASLAKEPRSRHTTQHYPH